MGAPKPETERTREKASVMEMLSLGGAQFAVCVFMAFSAYYLMMFLTDVALIPPATTAAFLLFYRFFCVLDTQAIGLFINRRQHKDGKYRPYFKWCALPYAIGLAALGLTPGIALSARVFYAAGMLILCDLSWSALSMASIALLPYLAQDDVSRSKFVAFSNGSAILAYVLVGTFMLPLADALGGGDRARGIALVLALLAAMAAPLILNAYFRLQERDYGQPRIRPSWKDTFSAIGRSKRILLFLAGYGLYTMADAFKNLSTYYYVTHFVGRPDLLPMVILAGLLSPLAMQAVIPKLLAYAKKEDLIVFGLFAALSTSLLMFIAGANPFALMVCVTLYGVFTAIVANLVFAVMASFSDDIRMRQNISMSEILAAAMNLSATTGSGIAGGIAASLLALFGYAAQESVQTASALMGIRMVYILCTALGMAIAGVCMLLFRRQR